MARPSRSARGSPGPALPHLRRVFGGRGSVLGTEPIHAHPSHPVTGPHDPADTADVADADAPGEAVGAPGIAITTRPESDGSFLVSEVITLPAPTTEAVLRPPSIGDAGTRFKQLLPTAMQVEVSAGGQALAVPNGSVRSEVMLRWDSPTQQLRLRYRLTQVSVASQPAKAGRTVAALGSLLDRMPADLPVKVVVTGRTVLSLTCPQLPLARLSCGAGAAPKFWTLRSIPFDRSQVLVQYDRPARP